MRWSAAFAAGLVASLVGCSGTAPGGDVSFPHEAAPIEGVCSGAHARGGLAVTVEAPFKSGGQRRFKIVNASAAEHEVAASFVVANAGRCDRAWTRSNRLAVEDRATCEPPRATTLPPGQAMELRLVPHLERSDEACTKVGLALHAKVDGEPACFELGAWIVYRPGDE